MQIQITWLLQKPTDLDLHCLQRQVYPDSAGQGLTMVSCPVNISVVLFDIYHIYPKYWDTLTPYHTCPNILKKSIFLPVDMSKIVLDEWQTL